MPLTVGPTSLDFPAWVQAVGSIAAIATALYLAQRETRRRRDEALFRNVIISHQAYSYVNTTSQMVRLSLEPVLENETPSEEEFNTLLDNLHSPVLQGVYMTEYLVKLSPVDWPNVSMAAAFIAYHKFMTNFLETIESVISAFEAGDTEEAMSFYGAVRRFAINAGSTADLSNRRLYAFFEYYSGMAKRYRLTNWKTVVGLGIDQEFDDLRDKFLEDLRNQ